jgi:hypothetical protein
MTTGQLNTADPRFKTARIVLILNSLKSILTLWLARLGYTGHRMPSSIGKKTEPFAVELWSKTLVDRVYCNDSQYCDSQRIHCYPINPFRLKDSHQSSLEWGHSLGAVESVARSIAHSTIKQPQWGRDQLVRALVFGEINRTISEPEVNLLFNCGVMYFVGVFFSVTEMVFVRFNGV